MKIEWKWTLTGVLLLIGGCMSLQLQGLSRATILLSIQVASDVAPGHLANGIILSIDGGSQNPGGQFAFPAMPAGTAGQAEFVTRVELLPGHYRLSRLSGVTRGGVDELRFDIEVDMPIQVRAGATEYLGRITLTRAMARNSDAFKEDKEKLVRVWPSLRSRAIQRRQQPAITLVNRPPPLAPVKASTGSYVAPVRLDRSSESLLPRAARTAFHAFLQTKHPRAFAVTASGRSGSASGGANVVSRALRNCERASNEACRLFALDDTLVASINWNGPK